MPTMKQIAKVIGMAMFISIALPVFAESAPVYDADSLPQQFDGVPDQGQQQDMPPAQQQDGGGAFVPIQQQQQQQPSASVEVSNAPVSSAPMSMDQRMRRVEQQVNNLANNDTSARVDSLQDQIQSLRGQVEQLTHQLAQMQSQQKSMYSDLDKRLSDKMAAIPAAAAQASNDAAGAVDDVTTISDTSSIPVSTVLKPVRKKSASKQPSKVVKTAPDSSTTTDDSASASQSRPAKTSDQPNVAEEQQIYQTAYNLIKAKKYNEAVNALNSMLKKYPSGQFAANAHYWLGELYGLMGKNDQAQKEFSTVVSTYPDSPRVSDAQLKVGLIFASQFKWIDAKSAFKTVINHYPGTASARLASEQLKQIRQAGH